MSSSSLPEHLPQFFKSGAVPITPAFPNWERSFISGPTSPLFQIEHRVQKDNPHFLISKVNFKALAEGPPGHVHGGASAALIDEAMGVVVWHNQLTCLTQHLNLQYLRTLPLTGTAYVVTRIERETKKKIEVSCTIYDQEKTPYVSAQGVFHRLTAEQLQKFFELKHQA